MKVTTQKEFDDNGIQIIPGDHSFATNPRGRHTWETFSTERGQRNFRTIAGLKRAITMNWRSSHEVYSHAIVVICPSYRIISWTTNERVLDGYHANIAHTA